MTHSDDPQAPPAKDAPGQSPVAPGASALTHAQEREARLAAALRANLRRRKTAPKTGV
jgi:hypothetical protein